jgi:hypothetical protein
MNPSKPCKLFYMDLIMVFSRCFHKVQQHIIVTRYGLEGPGIESRWGEIFRTYPDRLRDPPSLL